MKKSGEVRSSNSTSNTRQEYLLDLILQELRQTNKAIEDA